MSSKTLSLFASLAGMCWFLAATILAGYDRTDMLIANCVGCLWIIASVLYRNGVQP